ncbi:MAG: Gfo/Idh/MocA family oxidoreductase [bacterium]|nr:Gfo/Idh/MocA family oxidoreductase [bacterium]
MSASNEKTNVRIGLAGTGHLGTFHGNLLCTTPQAIFVGVYDVNPEAAAAKAKLWNVPVYDSYEALLQDCDAIDIVATTSAHEALTLTALAAGKHVFVEKPLAHSVEAGKRMVAQADASGLVLQVGHVERFNPAVRALDGITLKPMFIESHRLAQYKPRGVDVSVVFDLMIHDLDVILHLIDDPVVSISASGVAVVSPSPDIVNARIQFSKGQVANVTASRLSLHPMRKLRMFQNSSYVSLDFQSGQAEIVYLKEDHPEFAGFPLMPIQLVSGETKTIARLQPEAPEANAIGLELASFVKAIRGEAPIAVSGAQGLRALEAAHQIEAALQANAALS